ncbi:hypothetical protein BH23CHL8_BH23CHL8_24070 [soil metagenome]
MTGRRPLRLHIAVLLMTSLVAILPGAAVGVSAEVASPSPVVTADPAQAGPLTVPRERDLEAAADLAVDDTVRPIEGEIDIATLQAEMLRRAEALDAAAWEPPSLTDELDYDPDNAFEFVRDRIAFEPYRGLLRDAEGTLAARAGNSLDRAVLLRTMLDLMLVPTRLAFGELDEDTAGRLIERAFEPPAEPLPPAPDESLASLDLEAIATRAQRDYARLRAALGGHLEGIGDGDRAQAALDVRAHAWVQAFIGGEWVDLDPTLADAQPGDILTTATRTADVVPPEEFATVTLTLLADILEGEVLEERTVLSQALPAWQAARQRIFLSFQPEVGGVGGSIVEALGGAGSFVPHLMVDGSDHVGQPFPVRPGADIFSGEVEEGPEVARLRLVVGIGVPGRKTVERTRLLLDRVADGAGEGPLRLAPLDRGAAGPLALQPIHHLMVSTGSSSTWRSVNDQVAVVSFMNELLVEPDWAPAYDFDALFWPVALTNQQLVLTAERLAIPALEGGGTLAAFVAEPRVTVVTLGGDPDAPTAVTDLLHDRVAVLAPAGAAPGGAARAELWYGALQAATETEFLRGLMRGFGSGTVESVSTATAADLTAFTAADDARLVGAPAALRSDLASGLIVVVPGDPADAPGWWTVDQTDGTTRSVDPGGLGWGRSASAGRGGRPISTPSYDPNRFKSPAAPAPTCTAANEYTTPIGCVSLPGAIAFWGLSAAVAVAITWGLTVLWQNAIGYGKD